MFHDVLDDLITFPKVKCAQIFTYTIYRGVLDGWLEQEYLEFSQRSYRTAVFLGDDYGLVRNVCGMAFLINWELRRTDSVFLQMHSTRTKWGYRKTGEYVRNCCSAME